MATRRSGASAIAASQTVAGTPTRMQTIWTLKKADGAFANRRKKKQAKLSGKPNFMAAGARRVISPSRRPAEILVAARAKPPQYDSACQPRLTSRQWNAANT